MTADHRGLGPYYHPGWADELERRLVDSWAGPQRPSLWLRPLGTLYGLAATIRRRAYGPILKVTRAARPVIALGNLTVGGSGKTPLCLALARMLLERGRRPAILSRGYGRRKPRGPAAPLVVGRGRGPETAWADSGDEPWLMAAQLPEALVVVDARRARAARTAVEELGADVLLLDDGYQHLSLAADCRILVMPAVSPFGNGAVLPAGPLREPVAAHRLADILVCTGAGRPSPEILELAGERPVFAAEYRALGWRALAGGQGSPLESLSGGPSLPPEALAGRSAFAFCGLGRPEGFERSLRRLKVDVRRFVALRDHQVYSRDLLNGLGLAFLESGAEYLVTTAKDAVKIPADFPLPVMAPQMEMTIHRADDFLAAVERRVFL